mmetsp:Transcript_34632/g.45899  ORF Transcript_34632/g.45899 Transcript_34632/m.45899 type:complete len:939 (+) Transcript_34632:125-2941(+)
MSNHRGRPRNSTFQDEPAELRIAGNENNPVVQDGAPNIEGLTIDLNEYSYNRDLNERGTSRQGGADNGNGAIDIDDVTFNNSTIATDDVGHDVTRLYTICEEASNRQGEAGNRRNSLAASIQSVDVMSSTWDAIREWLAAHPMPGERAVAATYQGQFMTTALHIVCKLQSPPTDIVQDLIDCAPETVAWADSNDWLPLHLACAFGASYDVLSLLVQAYPEGRVAQDKRRRTPLHFAFGATRSEETASDINSGDGNDESMDGNGICDIVRLLSDSGAARLSDGTGKLPIHYACAYGTSAAALQILFDTHPNSIFANEDKGRTPLHFAMVNAHRPMSPSVVAFLLSVKDTDIINIPDNSGDLPLSLFAKAVSFDPYAAEKNENAFKCLELYINAKPHPTAEFYEALFAITSHNKKLSHEIRKRCFRTYLATKPLVGKEFFDAIKRLPTWLQIEAFISPSSSMMEYLNSKTSEPIPTMMLMLDFTFLVLLVVFFQLSANETIDCLFDNKGVGDSFPAYLGVLLTISIYLCVKEIMQIIRYFKAGSLRTLWFSDVKNILDVCLVVVTFLWCSVMFQCIQEDQSFDSSGKEWYKAAMAFTVLLYTLTFLLFLKSVLIDFAVFVSGMTNVIRNLLTFLVSLMIVLLAFAGAFALVFQGTRTCNGTEDNSLYTTEKNGMDSKFCTFRESLVTAYFMLLGQIGPEETDDSIIGKWIYAIFMFIVVILLTNVLIAIVTESYNHIKASKAQQVFWYNRFAFICEVDAIAEVLPKHKCFERFMDWSHRTWRIWNDFRNEEIEYVTDSTLSIDSFLSGILFLVTYFLVFLWLIAGLVSLGLLWPPQVRKFIFGYNFEEMTTARVMKHAENNMNEGIMKQINDLKKETKMQRIGLKKDVDDIKQQINGLKEETRMQVNRLAEDVNVIKAQMNSFNGDMEEIKELLRALSKE